MTTQETPERLLTTREAASVLGLSVPQLSRMWQQQRIPGYILGNGRIIRFRATELEAALRQHDERRAAELEVPIPGPAPEYVHVNFEPDYTDDRTAFEVAIGMLRSVLKDRFRAVPGIEMRSPGLLADATIDLLLDPNVNALLPELYTPAAREKRQTEQTVYFAAHGNLVKIGVSVNPEARVESFSAVLVATEPGGRVRERELHDRFAGERERGEWFREHDALAAYVEALPTFTGWPT